MSWTSTLPEELQHEISQVIKKFPQSEQTFFNLYTHLVGPQDGVEPPTKKQKIEDSNINKLEFNPKITEPISPMDTIFQLTQMSFQSPIRKKLNLVFHLHTSPNNPPQPVLLIVHPTTLIPEYTISNFEELVRLCLLLPILGNSMNSKKKVGLLCLWLNEEASLDPKKNDPIICQLNFDLVKTQLIETGKIPPPPENESSDEEDEEGKDGVQPMNEAIVDFLQRQFQLCGIKLVNYFPSTSFNSRNKLTLNTDSGVAISQDPASNLNSLVVVEAYKGSKEGSLVFIAGNEFNRKPYLIFGFKKPVLIFEMSDVKHISYTNITRLTFSLLITIVNLQKESGEETLEFGMIDHQHYLILDSFIRGQRINDNSFDDELREKTNTKKDDQSNGAEGGEQEDGELDDSEDEEDGTYQVGQEEEDLEGGSGAGSGSGSESDSGSDMSDSGSESEDDEELSGEEL